MISTTNELGYFFEQAEGDLLIYGAGNIGFWLGEYLNRCQIDFTCFLDQNVRIEGALFQGKPVFRPEKLKEYSGSSIRLVLALFHYEPVLTYLLEYEQRFGLNILCFIPVYNHSIYQTKQYNTNRMLGFFRRKLYHGPIPTILSNTCMGGMIYEAMGMVNASPFINTLIRTEEFIRLCKDPNHYFSQSLTGVHYERISPPTGEGRSECLSACLGDITVLFPHEMASSSEETVRKKWELLCKHVDLENIVFVLEMLQNERSQINKKALEQFALLPGKKLLIMRGTNFFPQSCCLTDTLICPSMKSVMDPGTPIENSFDLLEWIIE